MDIQMPIMDGYQTTYHIRQNKELSYLPIIAMTAHVSPEDHNKSLQAGMNDHITKPLDPDSLLTILRKWA
jgi:CheY-like chemotaxis protein